MIHNAFNSIYPTTNNSPIKYCLRCCSSLIEYDGGIVQELRKRMPGARVLVVSIQREIPDEDWAGEPTIGDLMIVEKRND